MKQAVKDENLNAHGFPATAAAEPPPALALRLFGTFALEVRGTPASGLSRSARALLGLLAVRENNRALERASAASMLWPESDEAVARYNLRRTLMEVRQALGPEAHRLLAPQSAPHTIRLDLASGGAFCDVIAFDRAIAKADEAALRAAVALQASAGGVLLEGERGEWVYPEREARRDAYLTACERLARHSREKGDLQEAVRNLQAVLVLDPTRETVVRDLMTALSESGQTAAALAVYGRLCARLQKEAGAFPDAETTALYGEIQQKSRRTRSTGGTPAGNGVSDTVVPPLPPPLGNVPRSLTALIGRERDVLEVTSLLNGDKDSRPARLLTLLGAGGVGKTRLALAVAQAVASDGEREVCFVDFAPMSVSARLASVTADALRLKEPASSQAAGDESRFLTDALGARRLLLVFDNCEHVAAEAARLATALLRVCPNLGILGTSRAPLHVPGEITWRVPGLAQTDAARLFLVRAAEANSAFHPQAAQQEAVQAIVTRLDGIPMAIEMAAARTRALPVPEIAARLDNVFRLLTVPGGDLLPRHRTLRATLDWSYDLLSVPEQTLLGRLSVFAGGWTLEAVEAVCPGGDITEDNLFNLLASLIEKSLVQFHLGGPDDPARYRMLETVRQYSREKLEESGAAQSTRDRHRDWYLTLAEEAEPHLTGPGVAEWNRRLEREHDNLRAALDDCAARAARGEWEAALTGLRLAGALMRFWWMRGFQSDGREYLKRALASRTMTPPTNTLSVAMKKAIAVALNAAGVLAENSGDFAAARSSYEDSLAHFREVGDKRGIAAALGNLGNVALNQSDYPAARSLEEESLRLYREIGHRRGTANMLGNLGNIASDQGDTLTARTLYQESLGLFRELGDRRGTANMLNNLGNVARDKGEEAAAKPLYEESLRLFREMNDKDGIARILCNTGNVAYAQGDRITARQLYEESIALYREVGSKIAVATSLVNLGGITCDQGDFAGAKSMLAESLHIFHELGSKRRLTYALDGMATVFRGIGNPGQAIVLWAAADALRESLDAPLAGADQAEREKQITAVRAELGEVAFSAAWSRGQGLSLEQTLTLSLSEEPRAA